MISQPGPFYPFTAVLSVLTSFGLTEFNGAEWVTFPRFVFSRNIANTCVR